MNPNDNLFKPPSSNDHEGRIPHDSPEFWAAYALQSKDTLISIYNISLYRHSAPTPDSLDWIETELPNILGLLEEAYRLERWRDVCFLVGALCDTHDGILMQRGHWTELREWLDKGLVAAQKIEHDMYYVFIGHRMTLVELTDSFESYQQHLNQVMEFYDNFAPDHEDELSPYLVLAAQALYHKDYREAEHLFQQCLELYTEQGDEERVANTLASLGQIAHQTRDYKKARDSCKRSLDIYQRLEYQGKVAQVYLVLGLLAHETGDFDTAQQSYENSYDIAGELGHNATVVNVLLQKGVLAWDMGDHKEVIRQYEIALAIAEDLGNRAIQVRILRQLGLTGYITADLAKGRRYLRKSLDLAKIYGNRFDVIESQILLYSMIYILPGWLACVNFHIGFTADPSLTTPPALLLGLLGAILGWFSSYHLYIHLLCWAFAGATIFYSFAAELGVSIAPRFIFGAVGAALFIYMSRKTITWFGQSGINKYGYKMSSHFDFSWVRKAQL